MKKFFLSLILLIALVGTSLGGYSYIKYKNMVNSWYQPLPSLPVKEHRMVLDAQPKQVEVPKEKIMLKPFTLMILGNDSREGEHKSRSDTIMLAAINPMTKQISLLSIPRDTLADIPGHHPDKFNHSMFYGGPSLARETMEKFFKIPVDHYISVDFQGFIKIVDAIGGISVDVKRRMKYHDPVDGTNIDLKQGLQTLDGKKALDYARFRKSDFGSAASDFERMQRQQEVLRKVAGKTVHISSMLKLFTMMDILGEHVKTDLREEEIRRLAVLFHDFDSSKITSIELQGLNKRMPMHGYNLWFYVVGQEEKDRISALIKSTLSPASTIESANLSSRLP